MSKARSKATASSGSEDSDSGPDDRNAPPAKKAKPSPAAKPKGNKASYSGDNDEEPMFQLARMRYVKVREFRGKVMIDIREYYDADGDLRPGKKGICLTVDQWNALKNHIEDIDRALKRF